MLKTVLCLAAVLAVATGCTSARRANTAGKELPESWDSELGAAHEAEPDFALPSRPLPAPAPAKPVASAPAPLTIADSGMVSLNRWAQQNGYRDLRTIPLNPVPAYALLTAHGNLAVQVGRLAAFWDGLQVRLGFAPQQSGGQIFLNSLDLKKVVEPLSRGLAVTTPSNRLVVIDPGHGGGNTGTRSVLDGRWEKEFTLDWAKRLAPLLEQNGWRVLLTRTNDVEVPLPDRVAFAEKYRADLFLSLHFNSSGGGQDQEGLETYCLTPAGMPSSLTRGYEDDVRQAFPNNAFDAENLRYAVRIHRALLPVTGNNDRGVRWARFLGVLRGQNRPAVLIEAGYLSNPAEARRVADPAYRQKLAEAIATALE